MEEITFTIELITPQIAMEYLKKNTNNRKIKNNVIDRYADDIAKGKWKLTHQGISFNNKDELDDGQHRLMAIVKANIAVKMVVARYNIEQDMGAYDLGVTRTTADVLKISGYINGEYAKTRVIGFANTFRNYVMHENAKKTSAFNVGDWINNHQTVIRNASEYASWGNMHSSIRSALVAAEICGVSKDTLKQFVNNMMTGEVNSFGHSYNYRAVKQLNDFAKIKRVDYDGGDYFKELYRRTQRCIYMFANNIKNTTKEGNIYGVTAYMLDQYEKGEQIGHT